MCELYENAWKASLLLNMLEKALIILDFLDIVLTHCSFQLPTILINVTKMAEYSLRSSPHIIRHNKRDNIYQLKVNVYVCVSI